MYTIIHKRGKKTTTEQVRQKSVATDAAYFKVLHQGGTSWIIPSSPMRWGNVRISRLCFYWRKSNLLSRYTEAA